VTIRVPAANWLPRWNLFRWISVAASVSKVNTSTVGTAMRALAQTVCRPASASNEKLAQ
jgi:hypothetical protein